MPGPFHLEAQLLCNAAVLCLFLARWRGWKALRRLERWCVATSARPVWLTFLTVLAFGAAAGCWHIPAPAVHDEFAYLLAGDTFAHGRLTNATHPLWSYLEVPHVLHRPTYQAKYPPLQGLCLAFGQATCGLPIAGVWLSYAAACAAVVWMLQAGTPRRWALRGGLLCACNPCMTLGWMPSYSGAFGGPYSTGWGQSYWGGAIAMLGGALVFGAAPRWAQHARVSTAALLGVGLVVLAHSRPYEGLVAVSLPAAWFVIAGARRLRRFPSRMLVAAVVTGGILALGAAAMLIYNQAVTGDPFVMPYQVWKRTYSGGGLSTTLFWAGVDRNERLHTKLWIQWEFFIRFLLLLPLTVGTIHAATRGRKSLALFSCALTLEAVLLENTRGNPHYLAPVVAPLISLCVLGFRCISLHRWQGLPLGRALVRSLLLVYVASFAYAVEEHWFRRPIPESSQWSATRAKIQQQLLASGGQHLVFVRYRAHHSWYAEWTYNQSAIDESPVVWVRDRGPSENVAVTSYFQNRRHWIVDADEARPAVRPYDASPQHSAAALP